MGNRSAQKRAAREQIRASRRAQEDQAAANAEKSASGRRLRGLGRRVLAFAGNESGLADKISG